MNMYNAVMDIYQNDEHSMSTDIKKKKIHAIKRGIKMYFFLQGMVIMGILCNYFSILFKYFKYVFPFRLY